MKKKVEKALVEYFGRIGDFLERLPKEAGTKKFASDLAKQLRRLGDKTAKVKCQDGWYYADFNKTKREGN